MFDQNYTCAFAGPRPQHLPCKFNENHINCIFLKNRLREMISQAVSYGYVHFISGMALGVDTWAAELILELKQENDDIILECAIPCEGQEKKWNSVQQERYRKIVKQADMVTLIRKEYTDTCMLERNKYMVEHSSLLIAVYDGGGGGTGTAVKYAAENGIETWIIDYYS